MAVYASTDAATEALACVDHGQQTVPPQAVGELAVYRGPCRLPCRLWAYRLPEEVVEQRRRTAYETARQQGRTPTPAYLPWLQYGWYGTHVAAVVWAAEVVATVERIRGQIALLVKQWQSFLHRHVLKGTRSERITCLLDGRLLTITMLMRLCSSAAWYATTVLRRAISFPKLMRWLKRTGRFAQAVQEDALETLCGDLRRAMAPLLGKQKRKRQTSHQLLDQTPDVPESSAQEQTVQEDQAA